MKGSHLHCWGIVYYRRSVHVDLYHPIGFTRIRHSPKDEERALRVWFFNGQRSFEALVEVERKSPPARIAWGVGLNRPCTIVVPRVASENVNMLSVHDGCCCCTRVLHRGNGFPFLGGELVDLACWEKTVLVSPVLPTPEHVKAFVEQHCAVGISSVDHVGEQIERILRILDQSLHVDLDEPLRYRPLQNLVIYRRSRIHVSLQILDPPCYVPSLGRPQQGVAVPGYRYPRRNRYKGRCRKA